MIITKALLIILFFSLPLIHGGIFSTLGFDFKLLVSGNFEFTKSIFFNIFSGLIFLSFVLELGIHTKFSPLQKERGYKFHKTFFSWLPFPKEALRSSDGLEYLGQIKLFSISLCILLLSTYLSFSPFTSLIGDDNKGHTALLYFNLIGIFFILKNLDKKFLKTLITTSLLSGVFVSFIAIKELYFPTFNYGNLADRALGSFGHPNYLAGYLVLLLPFIFSKYSCFQNTSVFNIFIFGVISTCIFLSKSIVALILLVFYTGYLLSKKIVFIRNFNLYIQQSKDQSRLLRRMLHILWLLVFILAGVIIGKYFPEKLHSFLSRFYIWETTLGAISSDWKTLIFGGGPETLSYIFDNFKSPEVYIYENFGFTADRPHNFFLSIFYNFGLLGVSILMYFLFKFYKSFCDAHKNAQVNSFHRVVILFLLFGIIHYFSITSYLIVVLCIVIIGMQALSPPKGKEFNIEGIVIWSTITLFSLTGAYYSLQFYRAELEYSQGNYSKAQTIFSHPKYLIALGRFEQAEKKAGILSVRNIKTQIKNSSEQVTFCDMLVKKYPSAENYFYCGEIFENLGNTELSQKYYTKGLKFLPDLWNAESEYWNNYFIKNTITGNRFFSEKFGDIRGVLEKIEN